MLSDVYKARAAKLFGGISSFNKSSLLGTGSGVIKPDLRSSFNKSSDSFGDSNYKPSYSGGDNSGKSEYY